LKHDAKLLNLFPDHPFGHVTFLLRAFFQKIRAPLFADSKEIADNPPCI